MAYVLNTPQQQAEMLQAIGAGSIEELFAMIPPELRLQRPLDLPPALCELELLAHCGQLAQQNQSCQQKVCFLGAGSYDHFIPSVVDHIASRGEFYTSYTPYQPEASQGNLQAFFEYQTLITQLTGMDVSNASLYDGASAATEAVLMALAVTKRSGRVVVAGSVHPEYREVLATYLANVDTRIDTLAVPTGVLPADELAKHLGPDVACVLVQHPNFFGNLEDLAALARVTHEAGALLVVAVDPLSLGLLRRPGDCGADIVVAEGQSLGSPLSFGGPYLGILACREAYVRRMPGRIAGQTVDRQGRRCWVLTLQTREQHIRREKATSNICTNQGLFALRAAVYLAAMGPAGLAEVSRLCLQKAHYARERIEAGGRFRRAFEAPCFKEFVVRDKQNQIDDWLAAALEAGILAGVPLARWYPELEDAVLITVTEKRTRAEIDALAALCGPPASQWSTTRDPALARAR